MSRSIVKKLRVNEQIFASTLRLIDDENKQIGIITKEQALTLAKERELDLVEVSPQITPPVCKLMDYGKYLYKQNKLEQKQKKMQKKVEVKGVRMSLRTGEHDLDVKAKQAKKFLEERNLVKIQLIFKGRENLREDLGRQKLNAFSKKLEDIAKIEEFPKRQGNSLIMILSPHK